MKNPNYHGATPTPTERRLAREAKAAEAVTATPATPQPVETPPADKVEGEPTGEAPADTQEEI